MSLMLPSTGFNGSFARLPPTPPDSFDSLDKAADTEVTNLALHVLKTERDALSNLHDLYFADSTAQRSLNQAVNALSRSSSRGGTVNISGMGKSGKIGKKFEATLNSLAIKSAFLNPTDALHGDLGKIGSDDALVVLSFSGQTSEILKMLEYVPADLPLVAITAFAGPSLCPMFIKRPLGKCILLPAPIPCSEAETFGFPAPTSSTTTALALTDALALALARRLHRDPGKVFQLHHPGGVIGTSGAQTKLPLMGELAINLQDIPVVLSRHLQTEPTVLDVILTAAKSASGWVRPSPDTILSPRQVQRIGYSADSSQPLRLLGGDTIVDKKDWISVEASNTKEEVRDWILRMKKTREDTTFLRPGTILGIVSANHSVTGVAEIEEIVHEDQLTQ